MRLRIRRSLIVLFSFASVAARMSGGGLAAGVSIDRFSVLLVFVDEAVDEWDEFFAGSRKYECTCRGVPIEFEAGRES
jgi:hypothetical protein